MVLFCEIYSSNYCTIRLYSVLNVFFICMERVYTISISTWPSDFCIHLVNIGWCLFTSPRNYFNLSNLTVQTQHAHFTLCIV